MKKIIIVLLTLILLTVFVSCSNITFINSADESSGLEIIGEPKITVTDDSDIGNTWYNLHITGTCKNNSEYDYNSASFILYFYDIDNNELAMVIIDIDDIKSGEKVEFYAEDIIYKEDYENIHWYELPGIYTSKDSDPTQEEIDEQLKQEAVEADFTEIASNNWNGKQVYAIGEVNNLNLSIELMPEFLLGVKIGENEYGVYMVRTFSSLPGAQEAIEKMEDGSIVKVYGTVSEEDLYGIPTITSTIIEFIE